jgi:hypothetical protein
MNTKVEDNFVAHNMDTKFELFGGPDVGDMVPARKGYGSGKSG